MTTFSTEPKLGGQTCLIAHPKYGKEAERKANSYWCPIGPNPGKAWVLLTKGRVDALTKTGPLTLTMNRTGDGSRTNSFQKLYFVHAKRLLRGGSGDSNAAYLVELEDVRRLAWMSDTANAQYNVRGWSMNDTYLEDTTNEGTAWTWATMVADLWGKLPTVVGAAPTLPYTPHGTPENWKFIGVSAWEALHQVLHKLHCTTAYNPTAGTFSFVALGAEQSGVDSIAAAVTHDVAPVGNNTANVPEKIRVYFNTHHLSCGQERDTEEDENWSVDRSEYHVDIATGVSGVIAGTIVEVWDDLTAIYNDSDTLDNDTALNARATEIKNKWVQAATTTERHRLCIGIDASILPGSQIRSVLWRHWGEELGGSVTEYVSHPGMPRPWKGGELCPLPMPDAARLQPTDIGRATYPNFPRIVNTIEIIDPDPNSEKMPGDEIDPDDNDMWNGEIKRYVGMQVVTLGEVKVLCPEYADGKQKLKLGAVVMGRLSGRVNDPDAEGTKYMPVYLAELPDGQEEPKPAVIVQLNSDLSQWANGEEFQAGCQVQSGEVVSACGGSDYLVGQTVDVVFPHVRDGIVAVKSGDQVSAVLINAEADPLRFAVTSDYTKSGPVAVMVEMNDVPAQWANGEEYEPGCQVASGTVAVACSSNADYLVGEQVDVVFPHVNKRLIAIESGDIVSAVLLNDEADPKRFAVTSDYTKVDYGCGLKFTDDTATLEVDADKLAGSGLVPGETCDLMVNAGCGIVVADDKVAVKAADLAGLALFAGEGDCSLNLNTGCGLTIVGNKVQVLPSDLAGGGLTAGAGCQLQVNAGCGITLTGNAVTVDANDLAGPGLVEFGACGLAVNVGCGLLISDDAVVVDASDLAGKGLVEVGECSLMLDLGCGLKFDGDEKVAVDNTALAGEGLEADDAGCALKVSYGCGLSVESNKLKTDPGAASMDTEVEYVSKVECVEGELIVTKKYLQFGCGLFLGTADTSSS